MREIDLLLLGCKIGIINLIMLENSIGRGPINGHTGIFRGPDGSGGGGGGQGDPADDLEGNTPAQGIFIDLGLVVETEITGNDPLGDHSHHIEVVGNDGSGFILISGN